MWRRAEIWLGLMLVAAVTVGVLAGRRGPRATPSNEEPSSFLSGPGGSKAVYDVLARLGHPVERRRTSLFDLAREGKRRPAVLVVVAPPMPLYGGELTAVTDYVRRGGAVVAVGDAGGLTSCFGWETRPVNHDRFDSVAVRPPPGIGRLPMARAVFAPPPPDTAEDSSVIRRFRPGRRSASDCVALTPLATDTVLATSDHRPVILRLRYALGGPVTLIAENRYLRNRAWRETAAPYVVLPLLLPPKPGRITWDEYHHGYGSEGSLQRAVLAWLAGSPVGWALLQLTAVLLLWLGVAAVRFGPAQTGIDVRRRSPLEHVEALAAGLAAAGPRGVDVVVNLVVAGLARRLGRSGRMVSGASRDWLTALEVSVTSPRGRAAVRTLRRVVDQPGGPSSERLLKAAQAVEDVWQELRPQGTPV
ncbi:MAG TPA: DUF4350 domain-containing protein [Gemmatimonadales bacterium]|nr:DUF4350 domain-containing protein [Gemmatimonadales bacterium]